VAAAQYDHGAISRDVAEQRLVSAIRRRVALPYLYFASLILGHSAEPFSNNLHLAQDSKPPGAFLLRRSGAINGYVVSLAVPGKRFAHVKVTRADGGLKTVRSCG
jgi:hypothetical protein